jgi:DNA topoisomerase-1
MTQNLIIVESPAKSRTIEKYLGKDFKVLASYGHVRDLIPKTGAVEPEHNFAMHYEPIERNEKHVKDIIKALKTAKNLYLATDPDREGEAIAWHLCELLRENKKLLANKEIHRIVFHEITKTAVTGALESPRDISMDLVHAQQARRALDYLVGFNLSPLLWKKIKPGLSAGRVQSPALRMIVEREEEIAKFISQEYWSIEAKSAFVKQEFDSKLITYNGQKVEQFTVISAEGADSVEEDLLKKAKGKLLVTKVEKKQRKKNPVPPFITATLQQEAARKLGFNARRTMMIAQQLYEGIDIGSETIGLITYMRTDSFNIANEAIEEIRKLIVKNYGKENLPDKPCFYKNKSKNAQEAHEAIRPTSAFRLPKDMKQYLSEEQYKLYNLIWQRTITSQMVPALIDTVAVDLECGKGNIFRANGSSIAKPGFMAIYQEGRDEKSDEDQENILPNLKEGDVVDLLEITGNQHFTEPPPRYTEASLIKALEEHGIGRPSTYATIISTIQEREYVTLTNKQFIPTEVGKIVNKFLTEYFMRYVDYDFTANLEDELDEIARGEKAWLPVLKKFWKDFSKQVTQIGETVSKRDVMQNVINETCPECGKPLVMRLGKRGNFVGCSGYPDCKFTKPLPGEEKAEPEVTDKICPDCGHNLIIRMGRYGKFLGCSNYPNCKHMEPLNKPEVTDTGIQCPLCKKANIMKRKSHRGKIFYSCGAYPDCKYAIWYEPINEKCPKCGWPILMRKVTKKGEEIVCPQKECGYKK